MSEKSVIKITTGGEKIANAIYLKLKSLQNAEIK